MSDAARRMDRMYRFQRHIYDFTRRPYLLGRDTLINGLCPSDNGTLLEFGCGTARNLIRAANTYPAARLYGFDVSTVMLETARRNIAAAQLGEYVRVVEADATAFDGERAFGVGTYDRVFLSYTLSMIPAWVSVLQRAIEHVSPSGQLHIVDFGNAGRLPTIARVGLHAWLDQFDVTPRVALKSELTQLCDACRGELFHTDLHGGYAQYAVLTRSSS